VTKRRKRLLLAIAILLILLLCLGATIINYRATRQLALPFITVAVTELTPPQYLYSFSGPEEDRLERPIGVVEHGGLVYVPDSRRGKVYVFNINGDLQYTFGEDVFITPLYVARNPADGLFYVSDRRTRSIQMFQFDGTYVGEFDPNLPAAERPFFETGGVQWVPLAIAFDDDGTMYVTDLLKAHRVLAFDPDGQFMWSSGTTGLAESATSNPEYFQFPNNVKAHGEEIWVADSNNRRLKILDLEGEPIRLIPTQGLPRGFDFVTLSSGEDTTTTYAAVADTLSHDVTFWTEDGERQIIIGQRGILEGEFAYPNDLSVGQRNRIFVTDTSNARVQVWGWPEELAPIPAIEVPPYWMWCLTPLLLLPLLLLFRRKRFFATDDFIDVMIEGELVDQMAKGKGRKYWMVMPETYDRYRDLEVQDVKFQYLLHSVEHSDSDARDLMERLEIDYDTAALLSLAQRARVFCTEDSELRRLARALEIDVVDHEEYLERFGKRRGSERE
jgi:DNA-binding beta-propeller fold protein YncE